MFSKKSQQIKNNYAQKKFESDISCESEYDFSQSENDEKINVGSTYAVIEPMKEQPEFEINHFFNELPIRVLNSHEMPFFYGEDVAKVLGIKNIRTSITNFAEDEIVSQQLRRENKIVTYMRYKDGYRRKDNMVLLTEFGVYRLIINSRSERAAEFRRFLYNVLYNLRTVGEFKIKGELEELRTINEQQQAELGILKSQMDVLKFKQEAFKNLCEKITLIEIPVDPYEIEPSNLPTSVLKKGAAALKPKNNRIDNPVSKVYQLSQELGIPHGFTPTHTDMGLDELRVAHTKNREIAREFIKNHAPKHTYIVTSQVNPEMLTEGTATYSVYVKDTKYAMGRIKMKLADYRPARVSSTSAVYTCSREKITAAMKAVAD